MTLNDNNIKKEQKERNKVQGVLCKQLITFILKCGIMTDIHLLLRITRLNIIGQSTFPVGCLFKLRIYEKFSK